MSTPEATLVPGVDFVATPVTDYDASAEFYGGTLGLPFVKRWGEMPAGEVQARNLTPALLPPEAFGQEVRTSTPRGAPPVDDVRTVRADLEAKGVEFQRDTIDSGVCHMAIFTDPDGNTLMLHHRYAPKDAKPGDATS